MIIEFFGIPGAGKSTVIDYLAHETVLGVTLVPESSRSLPAFKSPLIRRWLRRHHLRQFEKSNPEFLSLIVSTLGLLTKNQRSKVERDFLSSVLRYQVLNSAVKKNALMISEGFLQRLLGISVRLPAERSRSTFIENYIELMPQPNLVFLVKIDFDTAKSRVWGRSQVEKNRSFEFDWPAWEACVNLTTLALQSSDFPVYEIQGNLPTREATEAIRGLLLRKLQNPAPGE